MKNHISRWILIPSYFFALLGIMVTVSLYFYSPQTFIPRLDPNAPGVSYLAQMIAARQFAIACVIIYSALKQSAPMLTISLSAFLIMQVQDIIIGIIQQDSGLIIGAFVVGTINAFTLFGLRRNKI